MDCSWIPEQGGPFNEFIIPNGLSNNLQDQTTKNPF